MRTFSIIFTIILISPGLALSQEPGAIPTSANQRNGPQPKKASSHTTTSAARAYLGKQFDIGLATVGPRFSGHDIVALTKIVTASPALKAKSEFESSNEYELRKAQFRSQRLLGTISPESYLVFLVGPRDSSTFGASFNYDADAQVLKATLASQRETFYLEEGYAEADTIIVRSEMLDRRRYTGSNAFGVTAEVTETYSEEYGLACEPGSWVFADSGNKLDIQFSGSVDMPPDEARRLKPVMAFLVICRLTEPWYRKSASGHDPTIDDPYKTTIGLNYLQVDPEQVWLINRETGLVIHKWAGPPSVVSQQEGLVLRVAATGRTWVAVSVDGKTWSRRTMEPNETQTFRAKNSFDVMTENAEGIILTLNGKTLDPLGRRGETKMVHLTQAGVER